jgi:hypothetical protein
VAYRLSGKGEASKTCGMPASTSAKNDAAPGTAKLLVPVFVLALVLFAIRLVTALHDPFFEGDAGQRMLLAHLPVASVGNRIWLPLLQVHIWVFYLLHLPYYTFKVIPCFYFFFSVLFLGLLTYRQTTRSHADLMFTLLLMLCFAYAGIIQFLSTRLYQEPLALAGFFVLLWAGAIELRYTRWLLLIGVAALLTREDFWIYLLALCLLNWKEILGDKRTRALFAFLWTIPALWLLCTIWLHRRLEGGKLPSSAVEWPLGINKEGSLAVSHPVEGFASFLQAVVDSRAIFLVAALFLVWAIGKAYGGAREPSATRGLFDSQFRRFSLLSLGVIYTLIILFNPWEATFANQRMVIPLLAQAFVWAGLLFRETHHYPAGVKALSRSILIAGMVLSLNPDVRTWIYHGDSSAERSVAGIAELVKAAGSNRPANVCIVNENYWDALSRFAGPALYAHLIFNPKKQTIDRGCDLLIVKSGSGFASSDDFKKYGEYQLHGRSYVVYRRTGAEKSAVSAANKFLSTLDERQRQKLLFVFEEEKQRAN